MTNVVQIRKEISSLAQPFCWELHHCSRSALRFPKDEDKRGHASEKCRKKAGGSANFDSEVWRPRIEEQTKYKWANRARQCDCGILKKINSVSVTRAVILLIDGICSCRSHKLKTKKQVFTKNILFLMSLKPHFPNTEPSYFLIHVEATCPALRVSTMCPTCPWDTWASSLEETVIINGPVTTLSSSHILTMPKQAWLHCHRQSMSTQTHTHTHRQTDGQTDGQTQTDTQHAFQKYT